MPNRKSLRTPYRLGSQNQPDGICCRFEITKTPDQATGRAFSFPVAGKVMAFRTESAWRASCCVAWLEAVA